MNEKMVSVIIPMYNLKRYIASCLDSLLCQTLDDLEIICVDDGSTDETTAMVRQYAEQDARIQLVVQQHAGQSSARNAALSLATGEFIYFLDGDDSIVPTALEEAVGFAQLNELELVSFDAGCTYETSKLANAYPHYAHIYERRHDHPARTDGPTLFQSMQRCREYFCAPPTYLFRREFLLKKALRFQEGIVHEDELFTLLALLRAQRAGYLHRSLFLRLLRDGSTMTGARHMNNVNGYLTVYNVLERELASGRYDIPTQRMVTEKLIDFLHQAVEIYRCNPQEHEECIWPFARMQTITYLFEREERVLASKTYRLGNLLRSPLTLIQKRILHIST